jgi:hypothetical protein
VAINGNVHTYRIKNIIPEWLMSAMLKTIRNLVTIFGISERTARILHELNTRLFHILMNLSP